VWPSGEKAGQPSPTELAGGEVSFRLSPLSRESKNKLAGLLEGALSVITRELPSGDQASEPPSISASFRSRPPRAGTSSTAAFPSDSPRRKAMERPSGDQAGLKSAAGWVVRRSSCSLPISLT